MVEKQVVDSSNIMQNSKRFFIIVVVMVMTLLFIVGCGEKQPNDGGQVATETIVAETAVEPTEEPTAETIAEPTEEPTEEPTAETIAELTEESSTETTMDEEMATLPDEIVAQLDDFLQAQVYTEGGDPSKAAPGLVLLVDTPDGQYLQAAGVASLEDGTPTKVDDRFEIGSNSKSFTIALLMQLQEEGVLSLDDGLSDWLPEWADKIPNGNEITLRQLAQHTSGIWDYGDPIIGQAATNPVHLEDYDSPEQLVQYAIDNGTPDFEPGAEGQWNYSNTGYILLGMILEAATGEKLGDLYQSRIFDPLGLETAVLIEAVPEPHEIVDGYNWTDDGHQLNTTKWNVSQGWAAGGLAMTAEDLLTYGKALAAGELFQDPDSLAQMLTFDPNGMDGYLPYGLGLMDFNFPGAAGSFGHEGQTAGFQSLWFTNPDTEITVVGLSNSATYSAFAFGNVAGILNPNASAETETVTEGDEDRETVTALVKKNAFVRVGPAESYDQFPNPILKDTEVEVVGRDEFGYWLQITFSNIAGEQTGWMATSLLTIDPAFDMATLQDMTDALVTAPSSTVAEAPSAPTTTTPETETAAPAPSSGPPAPVYAAPVAVGGFELGGQTHSFSNPTLMSSAGMNWVKFQHKWGPGGNPNDLAGRINNAHGAGFKVLLSIPGANTYPESINFEEYVQFLGGVAALGPDAIEVWNEMNIDFEWPAGEIDPASYVNNMLAPAYNAIKSANPNVMVVSGAPAPTGFDNNTNAWADNRYMAGMLAAGGGRYADCIGAHYNAGASSPSLNSGHPTGSAHYSWYLLPTLNVYAQLGKPVCFTELGYLSGDDYGGVPERFGWAAETSVDEHAAWLAEAVSVAANSGKVRMIIVFNVDFDHWGDDPQAGYAMIRKNGGCPACQTLANVMGR